eukprot:scaffold187409_cov21-Tisochrysis_lutea.AAC.1
MALRLMFFFGKPVNPYAAHAGQKATRHLSALQEPPGSMHVEMMPFTKDDHVFTKEIETCRQRFPW